MILYKLKSSSTGLTMKATQYLLRTTGVTSKNSIFFTFWIKIRKSRGQSKVNMSIFYLLLPLVTHCRGFGCYVIRKYWQQNFTIRNAKVKTREYSRAWQCGIGFSKSSVLLVDFSHLVIAKTSKVIFFI